MEWACYKGALKLFLVKLGCYNLKFFPDKIGIGVHLIIITRLQLLTDIRKILSGLEILSQEMIPKSISSY